MYIKKKIIIFVISFTMMLSLVPIVNAQAAVTSDVKIISNSQVTAKQAKKWAKSKGATQTFIDLADLYFEYCSDHGDVNPAIAYVQSAKETNYGNFGGLLNESYHNPCGLKIAAGNSDTDKGSHEKFNTWNEGVQAHLDHLALYAGADGYPKSDSYDQRQFKTIKGKVITVNSLGGNWAPSSTYGEEINKLYKDLLSYSGVKVEEDTKTTGWIKPNSNWYYLKDDGTMATGWIVDNGSKYYLYDTGVMAKGWINLNGSWYYLKDSGNMATGWVTSNGASYYLDTSTGRMLTNTTIEGYKIGSDGKKQTSSSQSDADTNNSGTNNPTTNKPSNSKKTIVIDPGHNYGGDGGAISTIDGVTYSETELNMQVSLKLKTELENRGYTVIMTREKFDKEKLDEVSSLTKRVNIANNANADFFISIHHNSAVAEAKGIETYYSSKSQDAEFGGNFDSNRLEKSKQMATDIDNAIANKLNLKNRGAKDSALKVCMNTKMPAVLVEVGFITNKEEAARCANSSNQQNVAKAIAEVISKNFK